MISFRFHLVSLVAVFLALGLGVLAGTTVINQGIVRGLENQTETLAESNADLQREVEELDAQVGAWEQAMPYFIDDELAGEQAILVTQQGTDDATVSSVSESLEQAGADVVALFSVGERMALPSETDRQALALAIGADGSVEPQALKAEAASILADRLAFGLDTLSDDVLVRLIRDQFLVDLGPELGEDQLQILSDADLVVAVAGGGERPAVQPEGFLVPFVEALAAASDDSEQAVGAAESFSSSYDFVTLLRGDGDTADRIVTQDNVDQVPGKIGLVLALDDLLLRGVAGHYGVKDGASSVLPPPPAT
jgi:hypothetical protein